MSRSGRVGAAVTAVAMVVGMAGPGRVDALPSDGAGRTTVAPRVTEFDDLLGAWLDPADVDDAIVIVTPGTDDTAVGRRTAGLVGDRESRIVRYPESLWPVISGRSGGVLPLLAPTYDDSREIAADANTTVMRALAGVDRTVVFTGFSQGSDALGAAAERAEREGLLTPRTLILLLSDPRGPWGVKAGLRKIPFVPPVMGLIGARDDGARDPGATGDADVVQVIVKGDPVADWQFDPRRPLASLVVDLAGFATIHMSTTPYSYADLDELEKESTLYSVDGDTRYEVYDTWHPLALFGVLVADAFGIVVDRPELARWDRWAERFYPIAELTPENAAPGVGIVTEKPGSKH